MSSSEHAAIASQPSDFTAHMLAVTAQHNDLRKLYAAALREIADLRTEVAALKAGHGISLIIAGRRFDLACEPPETAKARAGTGFLAEMQASEPNGKNPLADSFVL